MRRRGGKREKGGYLARKKAMWRYEKKERNKIAKYRADGGKPIFVKTVHIVPQTGQSFRNIKEYYDLDKAKTLVAILRKDKWIESCRVIRGEVVI